MSGLRPVWIHASLRADWQRGKRVDALLHGTIDHGFHYQGVRQAQLWLDVHKRHAPLSVDPSFTDIFRALSATVAASLAGKTLHVVGLGPGGGEKEAWLLEALSAKGCRLRYTPVDASLELALLSAEQAAPWVTTEILPIAGDLSLLEELPVWLGRYPDDEIRVYTAYGISPNFLPSQLFGWLSGILRQQDSLLLSANLAPVPADDAEPAYCAACEAILPQYDNQETRQWLRQILLDWGIAGYLSEPVFQIQAIEGVLGFVAFCEWLSDISFDWEGQPFHASRGDRLRLFFSLRYTPDRLAATLAAHGLALAEGQVTACGQEGVWRVARGVWTAYL